jgi:hypothetical protein
MHAGESSGALSAGQNGTSDSYGAAGTHVKAAPPPAPMQTSAGGKIELTGLSSGPSVCATERRDLREFHVAIELTEQASPEVLLLLRQWLLSAWQEKSIAASLNSECPTALFCVGIPPEEIHSALDELGKLMAQLPHQAFFAQLPTTQRLAQQWDESLPTWSLSTAAHFLLRQTSSSPLSPADESEKAWATLVEKNSGASEIARLGISQMREEAARLIDSAQLIVAGPSSAAESMSLLKRANSAAISKNAATSKNPRVATGSSPASTGSKDIAEDQPISHELVYPELLRLTHQGEPSYGTLVWRPTGSSAKELEVAMRVMVSRWREKSPRGAQAQVLSPAGINSWPVILLQGGYDAVESALVELKAEQDSFLSAAAGPSHEELIRARAEMLVGQTRGIEPRCFPPSPQATSTTGEDLSRIAIRQAAGPISVIWGTPDALVQSE